MLLTSNKVESIHSISLRGSYICNFGLTICNSVSPIVIIILRSTVCLKFVGHALYFLGLCIEQWYEDIVVCLVAFSRTVLLILLRPSAAHEALWIPEWVDQWTQSLLIDRLKPASFDRHPEIPSRRKYFNTPEMYSNSIPGELFERFIWQLFRQLHFRIRKWPLRHFTSCRHFILLFALSIFKMRSLSKLR